MARILSNIFKKKNKNSEKENHSKNKETYDNGSENIQIDNKDTKRLNDTDELDIKDTKKSNDNADQELDYNKDDFSDDSDTELIDNFDVQLYEYDDEKDYNEEETLENIILDDEFSDDESDEFNYSDENKDAKYYTQTIELDSISENKDNEEKEKSFIPIDDSKEKKESATVLIDVSEEKTQSINDKIVQINYVNENMNNAYKESNNHKNTNIISEEKPQSINDKIVQINYVNENMNNAYKEKKESNNHKNTNIISEEKPQSNNIKNKNDQEKLKTKWKIKKISESGENIEYVFDTKEEALDKIKSLSKNNIEITEKDKQGNIVSKKKIIKK